MNQPAPTIKALKSTAYKAAVQAAQVMARPTAALRSMPDYLILGGQRCGTTSLHFYLSQHPGVLPARLTKGVHWFDVAYGQSPAWYRSHFPLDAVRDRAARRLGYRPITGEGSPAYLFHPFVPGRVRLQMPDARVIALLRDPSARAWSAYHHERKRGFEELSFVDALDAEPSRLAGQAERLAAPDGHSYEFTHHGYVARGRYAEQLERWFEALGREQVLVLFTTDLDRDPITTMGQVHRFLGLPSVPPDVHGRWNKQDTRELAPELRARLHEAFAEPDRRLADLLGGDLPWSTR